MLLEKPEVLGEITRTSLININVPNLPFEKLKGMVVTGLGRRIYEESMQEGTDPRGRPYYWIGAGGEMFEDIPGSDCVMIDQGYVTVSVLRPSFLDERGNASLQKNIAGVFDQPFSG
jgi:5'-nucleotidase